MDLGDDVLLRRSDTQTWVCGAVLCTIVISRRVLAVVRRQTAEGQDLDGIVLFRTRFHRTNRPFRRKCAGNTKFSHGRMTRALNQK